MAPARGTRSRAHSVLASRTPDHAHPGTTRTWRGLLGLLALGTALAAATCVLGMRSWHLAAGLGRALFPVQDIVELAAVTAGGAVAGWVALHALIALACVLAHRSGSRWVAGERTVTRHAPAVVRRLARAAAGAGLGLALTVPTAMAVPDSGGRIVASADAGPTAVLDLGWQPTAHQTPARGERSSSAPPSPRPAPERLSLVNRGHRTGTERDPLVVVDQGDTLWAIAADQLAAERATASRNTGGTLQGAAPSDPEIAAAVMEWHAANRQALGPDPDLIHPGTVLRLP